MIVFAREESFVIYDRNPRIVRRASQWAAVFLIVPLLVLAGGHPAAEVWAETGQAAEAQAIDQAAEAQADGQADDLWDVPPAGGWPTLDEIKADAWLVLDRQTGRTVLEKNADKVMFPASTTKIMTAILALEYGHLDREVTVSRTAVNLTSGSSKVGFVSGEIIALRDVLAGLMVGSGNDAANVIAETLAGSNEGFALQMNKMASRLGMTSSHFCNPSGLQDYSHVVTARDMARLADYAMDNPEFRALVNLRSYAMPATNKHPYLGWSLLFNTNKLLNFGDTAFRSDYIREYSGIKTGSTDVAGNNLIAAAISVGGHELISVLMGVPPGMNSCTTFNYSRTLLDEAARMVDGGQTTVSGSGSETAGETAVTTSAAGQTSSDGSPATEPTSAPTSGQTTADPSATGIAATNTDGGKPTGGGGLGGFLTANLWRTAFIGFLLWAGIWLARRCWQIKRRRRRKAIRSLPIRPRRVDAP